MNWTAAFLFSHKCLQKQENSLNFFSYAHKTEEDERLSNSNPCFLSMQNTSWTARKHKLKCLFPISHFYSSLAYKVASKQPETIPSLL